MAIRADLGAWALLLIAMAIAYFVCLKASKEGSKIFQYGGYAIGVIILAISLILAVADVGNRIARRRRAPARRTRRTITRPTTAPKIPQLPRKAVGITEQK